ncbi:MAG: RNA-binding transcriptional accessory protein [Deltaproteobacteria bacterium]|nr:RNA-binding transcriptional accessory protein [Deltaproteobacteria bacterium]
MEQDKQHHEIIAGELRVKASQVAAAAKLLDEGGTVPFIARYRKEATGTLDETQIAMIRDLLGRLAELDKRRQSVLSSLDERGLLTDELRTAITGAQSLVILEDIYLPFRPKRRTRGMMAREKGLEPLARSIFLQTGKPLPPDSFINPEKEVQTADEALAGSRDIIAEWISEDAVIRARLRAIFAGKSIIVSTVVKKNQESAAKFRDYFDWREPAAKTPGHRILALFRGEHEKALSLSCRPPETEVLPLLRRHYVKRDDFSGRQVALAVEDGYRRLLAPSLENDLRAALKERADREAIEVFAGNLRELLLAPPLGQKRVMALDPGFRTGAKLACLDGQGKLLFFTTIYPALSQQKSEEAGRIVVELCGKYTIEAIAIGNGTAGRETEDFVRALALPAHIIITMVDESGASVYSASDAARAEFPDLDLTVRGAVSIGRRLQDPLAELVKIDPKSIGVGQYQHDVNQSELKKGLEDVVVSCVNSVGVEINTASMELLTFVSGLGPALARNIITWRDGHGPFTGRKQQLDVPRLGARAFEQCAGFLRIHGAENPLDGSGVHPERYGTVKQMARDAGCTVFDLLRQETMRKRIDISRYVSDLIGLPTLTDIMAELDRPGRDPRPCFSLFSFAEGVRGMDDLRPGMKLPGIVTNVTRFGAFVDIGVHQDGLIHISQLAGRFVRDPAEVVKVRQQVMVRVVEVDRERKRIALSLREV